jgi:hypothetical protein
LCDQGSGGDGRVGSVQNHGTSNPIGERDDVLDLVGAWLYPLGGGGDGDGLLTRGEVVPERGCNGNECLVCPSVEAVGSEKLVPTTGLLWLLDLG